MSPAPIADIRSSLARGARRAGIVALLALGSSGCFDDPQAALDQQQALTDLGDAVNELVLQTTELTATIDSLKRVIARQDTAIYRMANVTGVPYAPPR